MIQWIRGWVAPPIGRGRTASKHHWSAGLALVLADLVVAVERARGRPSAPPSASGAARAGSAASFPPPQYAREYCPRTCAEHGAQVLAHVAVPGALVGRAEVVAVVVGRVVDAATVGEQPVERALGPARAGTAPAPTAATRRP